MISAFWLFEMSASRYDAALYKTNSKVSFSACQYEPFAFKKLQLLKWMSGRCAVFPFGNETETGYVLFYFISLTIIFINESCVISASHQMEFGR